MVFFTNQGNVFTLKVSEFPSSGGYGNPVQKVLKFKDGESIVACSLLKSEGAAAPVEGAVVPTESAGINFSTLDPKLEYCLVSKQGMGYRTKFEGLEQIKRSGRKAMKLREGDDLCAILPAPDKLALITQDGYSLVIGREEILERGAPATGIILMKVKAEAGIVAALPYDARGRYELTLDSGKSKEIAGSELFKGHRGLTGQKCLARGRIDQVKFLGR